MKKVEIKKAMNEKTSGFKKMFETDKKEKEKKTPAVKQK